MIVTEHWHVNAQSGMMIMQTRDGSMAVAVPGRAVVHYKPEEVEHVVMTSRFPVKAAQ